VTYGDSPCLIAITGWGQEEDRRRAREAGFDCHLTKPADPDVLERLLTAISTGAHCDACRKCLHTPLTRSGDLTTASAGRFWAR
jgi:CheY-like chemotaxis protein